MIFFVRIKRIDKTNWFDPTWGRNGLIFIVWWVNLRVWA